MVSGLSFYRHNRAGTRMGNFSRGVVKPRLSRIEGPHELEWTFTTDPEISASVPESGLRSWYRDYFMHEIRVQWMGREVWRGWVGYMKLTYKGVVYIRDIKQITNTVKGKYNITEDYTITDDDGIVREESTTTTYYTDWSYNEESVRRYGLMEDIVESDSGNPLGAMIDADGSPLRSDDNEPVTEIELRMDQELASKADYIHKEMVPVGDEDNPAPDALVIVAYGAGELADRILLSDGDLANSDTTGLRSVDETLDGNYHLYEYGSQIFVSNEIKRIVEVVNYATINIISGSEPLLYDAGISMDNKTYTACGVNSKTSAMERMRDLSKLPDLDGRYYRLDIAHDGGVTYQPVDFDGPTEYEFFPESGELKGVSGEVPMWEAKPGLVRIIGESPSLAIPGTWLPSDIMWARRVEMRENSRWASLLDYEETEAEYQQAMWDNIAFMERMKDAKN